MALEGLFDRCPGESYFFGTVDLESGLVNVETNRADADLFEVKCEKSDGMKLSRRPEEIEGPRIWVKSRVAGAALIRR